jgi:hypothetical protein
MRPSNCWGGSALIWLCHVNIFIFIFRIKNHKAFHIIYVGCLGNKLYCLDVSAYELIFVIPFELSGWFYEARS